MKELPYYKSAREDAQKERALDWLMSIYTLEELYNMIKNEREATASYNIINKHGHILPSGVDPGGIWLAFRELKKFYREKENNESRR
jgi:hypothetical protein